MNVKDELLYVTLQKELDIFSSDIIPINILQNSNIKDTFIRQVIDSIRRVQYPLVISTRNTSPAVADPNNDAFDPIKAAVYYKNLGDIDEAVWLVFLSTHFGYLPRCKWLLTKDVYGGLGGNTIWNWKNITSNYNFDLWSQTLSDNIHSLSPKRGFGNHRKYESLRYDVNRSLSRVVSSYVSLILPHRNHESLFRLALMDSNGCRYEAYEYLYCYLEPIISFGRTARFDFLCMLGKLGIINIEPPKTYMQGSTGPEKGAKLLFNRVNAHYSELEGLLFNLNNSLSINPFGMQVLEDALCNWQKSRDKYVYFGG